MSIMCIEQSLTPVFQKSWVTMTLLDSLHKCKSDFENEDKVQKV